MAVHMLAKIQTRLVELALERDELKTITDAQERLTTAEVPNVPTVQTVVADGRAADVVAMIA